MSLKGKAALKVEEIIESADVTWDVTKMWDALDDAFLPINHQNLMAICNQSDETR